MDQFWRVLRIGCISVFVVIAIGVGSCILLVRLEERPKSKARAALWSRGIEIVKQKKGTHAAVKVSDLFGNDMDGICIVFNNSFSEKGMRAESPNKYALAISAIAQIPPEPSWDSDILYWSVYVVKGAAVLRKYELVFRSTFDMHSDDNRCHEPGAPLELDYFLRDEDGLESMFITIPVEKAKP